MPRAKKRTSAPAAACGDPEAARADRMSLEMKASCEKCNADLPPDSEARICSHECTFCLGCVAAMNAVCPNCGGELVARPKRRFLPRP